MLLIAVIFVLFFLQPVWGLQYQTSAPLSLEQCVEQALQNNPSTAAAAFAEDAAEEDVGAAEGRYYPEVLFRLGYRVWQTHVFLPEGVGRPGFDPVVGPVDEWRTNLRAQYTLFDSGLRSSELNAARAQRNAAGHDTFRVRNEIVYRVHSAYYELLAAQEEVELAKVRIERNKDHLRIATERKDVGAVPKSDVTRARVEVSAAELNLASAESAVRIARGRLNSAMGRPAHENLEIIRVDHEAADPNVRNVQTSIATAIDKRPEVRAALHRLEAKRSQIGAVRSEILPKVRAEAGYGYLDEGFVPEDRDWWVGITLDIPLFDGGTRKHRIARSKVEVSREQAQLDQLKLSIQEEVWTAYSRWLEAYQSIQTNTLRKEEADESLQLTKARYEEGADTINDLLDAELALDQAETGLTGSRYHLYIARTAFLLAAGEL